MTLTAAFIVGGGCEPLTASLLRLAADELPPESVRTWVVVRGTRDFVAVHVALSAGARAPVARVLGHVTACARKLPVGCSLTVAVRRPWGAQAVRLRVWEDGLRLETP